MVTQREGRPTVELTAEMMRCFSSILIAVMCVAAGAPWAWGEAVAEVAARRVALSWVAESRAFGSVHGGHESGGAVSVATVDAGRAGETLAFVVSSGSGGFVVVAGDDRLMPVLGYSATGCLRLDDVAGNGLFSFIRTQVPPRLAAIVQAEAKLSSRDSLTDRERTAISAARAARRAWADLAVSERARQPRAWELDVGPLLSTFWGQGYDTSSSGYTDKNPTFNYYAPLVTYSWGEGHAWIGCNATAMAQVMNYFQWPHRGTGSHAYQWQGQTLSESFVHTYRWTDMCDVYFKEWNLPAPSTEDQREAVGRLMGDCAVAVETDFSAGSSDALLSNVAEALATHFGFARAEYRTRGATPVEELRGNLTNGQPVIVSFGWHVTVCDGVRKETGGQHFYHVNFGWQGCNDGWYDITGSFPSSAGEGPSDDCPNTYWWGSYGATVVNITPGLMLNDLGGNGYGDFRLEWQHSARIAPQAFELQETQSRGAEGNPFPLGEDVAGAWQADGNWQSMTVPGRATTVLWGRPDSNTIGWTETVRLAGFLDIGAAAALEYDHAAANFWGLRRSVEVSIDGGSSWTSVLSVNGPSAAGGVTPESNLSWQHESVDLSQALPRGEAQAWLRFTVSVVGGNLIGNHQSGSIPYCGWYLDNITLEGVKLFSWSTVDTQIAATGYDLTGRGTGRYSYRVRPQIAGSWLAWSNIVPYEVVANPTRALQMHAGTGGTTSPAPGPHEQPLDAAVEVTALPDRHHTFAQWQTAAGSVTPDNPLTVIMDQDHEVTALFQPRQYDVTVASAHGSPAPANGTHSYVYGSRLTATCTGSPVGAEEGTRHVLTGWRLTFPGGRQWGQGGQTTAIEVAADARLTWEWRTEYLLDVQAARGDAVAVFDAAGRAVPVPAWLPAGAPVRLTALPDPGNYLDRWLGDVPAGANPGRVVLALRMDRPRAVAATFLPVVDGDEDELDDNWELDHWPAISAIGAGRNDNPDGDAFPNIDEFRNKTDPLVPTCHFRSGWNLVATARLPLGRAGVSDQLAELGQQRAWRWDGDAYAEVFDGAASPADRAMQPGWGYWVYSWFEVFAEIPGGAWGSGTVDVTTGWNLVGTIHGGDATSILPGDLAFWLWARSVYDCVVDALVSGCAYWVKCDASATVTMP